MELKLLVWVEMVGMVDCPLEAAVVTLLGVLAGTVALEV
jgi:hypothetical protein